MLDVQNTSQSGKNCNLIFPPDELRDRHREDLVRCLLLMHIEQHGFPAFISGRHICDHHEDDRGEPFICYVRNEEEIDYKVAFVACWVSSRGTYEVGKLLH